MNLDKLTTQARNRLESAQIAAIDNHNTTVDPVHLLLALLESDDSIVPHILQKMSINVNEFIIATQNTLFKLLRADSSVNAVPSPELIEVLAEADKAMKSLYYRRAYFLGTLSSGSLAQRALCKISNTRSKNSTSYHRYASGSKS